MDENAEFDWYTHSRYVLNQDLKSGGISREEYTAELLELNRERREERAQLKAQLPSDSIRLNQGEFSESTPLKNPLILTDNRSSYHGLSVAKRRVAQRQRRGAFFMRNALRHVTTIGRKRRNRA